MTIRPKVFLIRSLICSLPLLALSIINFRSHMQTSNNLIRVNLQDALAGVVNNFEGLVRERKQELTTIAGGQVREWVGAVSARPNMSAEADVGQPVISETRSALSSLLKQKAYEDISAFDSSRRQLFLAEPSMGQSPGDINFRMNNFLPSPIPSDEQLWRTTKEECVVDVKGSNGAHMRCTVPVQTRAINSAEHGLLIANLKVDSLAETAARTWETSAVPSGSRLALVLDANGNLLYQPSGAFRYQPVTTAFPAFGPLALMMKDGGSGVGAYTSAQGDKWLAAYSPITNTGLSLAVAVNYSLATQSTRVKDWITMGLGLVLGLGAALLLTIFYERKTQSLDRVTESVAAIAKGKLDEEVLLRSSDDMRLLADNVNLMTERLREQFAREAEARQFDSFVKLSAMLAHDLKNAIEGLSLMVGNMERHFDNPRFRQDAMHALTGATDKLRMLVARLSNPVNTLSGEFKMPRPTDLVPLLRRVLAQIAEPTRAPHEIEVKLPESLLAMADGERIEKVMENLVLNAIEAMGEEPGKLSIEGGAAGESQVFFSISDTGAGISADFLREKLFRPFATTKVRGVGLGLYTCREVVRANNGSIEVESVPGSGTTFRVVLASAQFKEARLRRN